MPLISGPNVSDSSLKGTEMALTNDDSTTEMTTKNSPPTTTAIAIKEKNDNEGFSSFQKFMIITVSILITIVVLMIFGFWIWLKTGFQNRVNQTVIAAQNP